MQMTRLKKESERSPIGSWKVQKTFCLHSWETTWTRLHVKFVSSTLTKQTRRWWNLLWTTTMRNSSSNFKFRLSWNRYCLQKGIYSTNDMVLPSMIDLLLSLLKTGAKTELVINVFLSTDFIKWQKYQIKNFLEEIKYLIIEGHEKNKIMLCYNPILTIALVCQFLIEIA